ncbi:MAG TPA: hypothetical protein DCL45_12225 [Chloroflexi bacterium]|nr:hypothetical protein [Chloroflexota bacterium]
MGAGAAVAAACAAVGAGAAGALVGSALAAAVGAAAGASPPQAARIIPAADAPATATMCHVRRVRRDTDTPPPIAPD